MSAPYSQAHAPVDLDDVNGLTEADRDGLLRAAATAGAQVRATAAAVDEGALESVAGGDRPRSVVWITGRGAADSAGAMLTAALGGTSGAPLVLAAESPPWIGPLDVMVAAGDDPGDPALVTAAATAVRRGARLVVAAPYEGPLRDATAGRAAVLEPRLRLPLITEGHFGLCRYLAAGLATMAAVDPGFGAAGLDALADELDAEALRNSIGRDVFTNAAKALAERVSGRAAVLAGDCAATLALARHGTAMMLRVAGVPIAAVSLADALVARPVGGGVGGFANPTDALFHDEELDGPLPGRRRTIALFLEEERARLVARLDGLDDVDLLGVQDIGGDPAGGGPVPANAGRVQQLAILAVRLEMAAVYLRLAGG